MITEQQLIECEVQLMVNGHGRPALLHDGVLYVESGDQAKRVPFREVSRAWEECDYDEFDLAGSPPLLKVAELLVSAHEEREKAKKADEDAKKRYDEMLRNAFTKLWVPHE